MNYEEKYNEALERAKSFQEKYGGDYAGYIFPELAESEDERIRKWLVDYFKEVGKSWIHRDINPEQIIAYLEKQKEQKPELPKPHKGDDTNPYDMSVSEAQEYAIKRGFGVPFNDGEVYVDERHITQTIGNILRWADEHPKEQKPWKVGANAYFTPELKPVGIPPYVTGVKGHPDPAGTSDLEEAAEELFETIEIQEHENIFEDTFKKIFIAGAEWQREQDATHRE